MACSWRASLAVSRNQTGEIKFFVVLFLWQFPHFLAIALMYREDYTRAGFKTLPQFDLDSLPHYIMDFLLEVAE